MSIRTFNQHRRLKRKGQDTLQHARHILHMREDLYPQAEREAAWRVVQDLRAAIASKQWQDIDTACQNVDALVGVMKDKRKRGSLVENIEMLIVAIAVAMGLRAYILQPFKIPTGSMQPTLNGITAITTEPHWTDRLPFKPLRFAITGEWYREVYARSSGRLGDPMEHITDPSIVLFNIGGQMHRLPRDILVDEKGDFNPDLNPDRVVSTGELLWAGRTQRGDHLFVNKIIWNFRKPRRDEVIVFTTDDIPTLEPGTHYIKRLVGMPEEGVSIRTPNLLINGTPLTGYFGIDRITAGNNGYAGFQLAGHLNTSNLEWRMESGQYFALGDNTQNSRDSRYWGPVPAENMVGPAFLVYWPFTSRWGLIR